VSGGTITGGAVDSGAITFGNGGTLSGVTMTGNFSAPAGATFTASSGTLFQTGTTTYANNIVRVGAGAPGLTIASDETWAGNLSIYAAVANASLVNNGTIKNTSATNYIYGAGLSGFGITNNGLIEATGGTLTIADAGTDVLTDAPGGTVEASGGNITLGVSGASVANFSSNTLTGGTWIASGTSALTFTSATNSLVTNGVATTIELSGAGSTITSGPSNHTLEQTLTTNNGTLEVLGGRSFASTSAGLTNNGILQLGGGTVTAASLTNGAGSTLSGFGTLNPTGGVAIGSGVLISPGSTAANQYVNTISLGGSGSFGAGGAYTFDIMNSVSPVAGVDNDTVSVAGTLTVSATPVSPFTISLESINPGTGLPGLANFSSAGTYQWTLLSASSISGFNASDFAINTSAFSNSLGSGDFTLSSTATDIYLNFTPVPEPSTWALIATGAVVAAFTARNRRSATPGPAGRT
jgi:hypothetical protein